MQSYSNVNSHSIMEMNNWRQIGECFPSDSIIAAMLFFLDNSVSSRGEQTTKNICLDRVRIDKREGTCNIGETEGEGGDSGYLAVNISLPGTGGALAEASYNPLGNRKRFCRKE